jgi:large subunit ribosomal protein L25
MSEQLQLSAELRTDVGKGASRRLRRLADRVPAIVYGAEEAPVPLTLNTNELNKAMELETFYSQVLDLSIDGKKQAVVVRDVQRHPAAPRILHIDFFRVSANKTLQVNIPLHFINEEECVGVRLSGGIVNHILNEVQIEALPRDIPEFIEVDMLAVELGDQVHLSDLKMPAGVALVALAHDDGGDHDLNIANVQAPRAVADEEATESVDAAAPAADPEDAPASDD